MNVRIRITHQIYVVSIRTPEHVERQRILAGIAGKPMRSISVGRLQALGDDRPR